MMNSIRVYEYNVFDLNLLLYIFVELKTKQYTIKNIFFAADFLFGYCANRNKFRPKKISQNVNYKCIALIGLSIIL